MKPPMELDDNAFPGSQASSNSDEEDDNNKKGTNVPVHAVAMATTRPMK